MACSCRKPTTLSCVVQKIKHISLSLCVCVKKNVGFCFFFFFFNVEASS